MPHRFRASASAKVSDGCFSSNVFVFVSHLGVDSEHEKKTYSTQWRLFWTDQNARTVRPVYLCTLWMRCDRMMGPLNNKTQQQKTRSLSWYRFACLSRTQSVAPWINVIISCVMLWWLVIQNGQKIYDEYDGLMFSWCYILSEICVNVLFLGMG